MLDNENNNTKENNNKEEQEKIYEVKSQNKIEYNECTKDNCNCNKVPFSSSFMAILIDEILICIISFALLFLVDALMRLIFGYYVVEKLQMYLIIYVIFTLFYFSIMENNKNGQTLGKKIMSLKTIKLD